MLRRAKPKPKHDGRHGKTWNGAARVMPALAAMTPPKLAGVEQFPPATFLTLLGSRSAGLLCGFFVFEFAEALKYRERAIRRTWLPKPKTQGLS